MTNQDINKSALAAFDEETRARVFSTIANHYEITHDEAKAEVTGADAEHLLDYLTGPVRTATMLVMTRMGMFPVTVA